MDPYNLVLSLHSLIRWLVLLGGLAAATRAIWGWLGRRAWTPLDNRLGLFFTISMDVQLLLGFILYVFLSPFTRLAFRNLGAAMANGELRFWVVEHMGLMVLAVVMAHVGRALSRRAAIDLNKHRQAAIFFTLAILAVLLAIPWDRPWLRLG